VADAVAAKILRNDATGEYLEVIPELGGKTEGLVLRSKRDESLREVLLDHHKDPTAIRGNAGWKGAMLVPFANRIKNGTYTLNGETHYLERNEDRGIYGKIALHGYLYRKAMNVRPAFPRRTLPRCVALWGW
jgi:aldose 1-epimerase